MMITAGRYALQYQRGDPAARAVLESWAAGVSAAVESGEEWGLTLATRVRTGAEPVPAKKPTRFLVEVNDYSSSVGAGPDGSFVIRVPLRAFQLDQRANDVTLLVTLQDGRDFGGWALGNMTFEAGGVGLAEPT
jgi:hypothetical protein